ncbi:MAG: histidine--tRNA ligase [Anaerolineales bacterium]|nr:MAG: histidine--tRNA ligase [Anaerolineales bacterium]
MPRYQRPSGTQDVLPEDQPHWAHVRARAARLALLAGFERIDVPIFERTELFTRSVGEGTDIVDKEMYSFTDRGKHEITLRPEFTAGVVRAYIENGMHVLPQPVKLYTFGPIFRDERPQAGRFRQHTQFNVEILGELDPAADLEVMLLAWDLYADLGFSDIGLQLNSTGCPQCKPGYIQELKEYYAQHAGRICDDCRRRLDRSPLRVLDCKADGCQPIIEGAPDIMDHLCEECEDHFTELRQSLDLLGRGYTINQRLVRGLDYYTKTVFEVWAAGIGAQSAICGGGRYDGLAEALGGRPTPGVGFGSGLERIIMVMQHLGIDVPQLPGPRVFLAHLGHAAQRRSLQLAQELRGAGVGAWLAFGERGLKAQLREANKRGVRFAVILGENELASGQAAVRDMESSEQSSIDLAALAGWLCDRLGDDRVGVELA